MVDNNEQPGPNSTPHEHIKYTRVGNRVFFAASATAEQIAAVLSKIATPSATSEQTNDKHTETSDE